jgi:5-hydroxyisourate hydrolase-like protein (transthyretin family)
VHDANLKVRSTCAALVVLCFFTLAALAAAQNITGTVTNGTSGKPAAGAEVTLLSLSQGMQEIGNTKADAQGHFSFPAPSDTQVPHMVRVTYQGVSYFPQGGPLMPGSTTADLTVYDAAKKVDEVSQTVEVDRFQSDGKQLDGIVLYALTNKSQPPRTVSNDKGTFEVVLPEGAEIESAQAKAPGGQPIATETNPGTQKNHYTLSYPLRPGETQFQVAYHMPYGGEASFSPKPTQEIQHFVVMMPKSMSFAAKDAQQFQQMQDQQSTIMVATNVKPGQDLSFRVAGAGAFPADNQQAAAGQGGGAMGGGGSEAAANDNRPGGGLGAPIDAPDPLHDYRAYLLGAFALVLVMGGAYIVSRSNRPQTATAGAGAAGNVAAGAVDTGVEEYVEPAAPRDRNALLLEAMKEELFQLEIDRQQGKLSAEEYATAKSALDETIKRALSRAKSG